MVNLKNCNIKDFFSICSGKRVYAYGVSNSLKTHTPFHSPDFNIIDIIYQLVDSDSEKWGTTYHTTEKNIPIISPQDMRSDIQKNDIILITSVLHYNEILNLLDSYKELQDIECFILCFIDDVFDSKLDKNAYKKSLNKNYCIPAQIHYFWFGNNKFPDKYLKNIESWEKMCPNYEIVKWDENTYDVNRHPYTKWAYENKKWALVSDYARLDIIYQYGGIYLDTDVEVIRNLDELRRFYAYIGYESTQMVATGLGFGAQKKNDVIKLLRDAYDEINLSDMSNILPCTVYQTNILRKFGLKSDNSFQVLFDNQIVVLPTEFLCGVRMNTGEKQITENTFSLHHYFSGGWSRANLVVQINEVRKKYCKTILKRISDNKILEFDY